MKISRDVFPFGLFQKHLEIKKEKCEIEVKYRSYRWIQKRWLIDVCRGPVHVKSGNYSLDVVKKEKPCPAKGSSFCESFFEIKQLIQDDGLIFAKGEKENILSEHGQIYCAYALAHKYLSGEEVLSRYRGPGPFELKQEAIRDRSGEAKVIAP